MFTRFEFMLLSKITAVLRAYFTVSWILIILLPVTIHAEEMYNYPIADPFAATVIGTPRAWQAPFSQIPSKQYSINVFKDRIVPNILQYAENLRYSAVFQDSPAPLAFIIAGTGGSDQEATISTYMKFLYNAGFHVICLPFTEPAPILIKPHRKPPVIMLHCFFCHFPVKNNKFKSKYLFHKVWWRYVQVIS